MGHVETTIQFSDSMSIRATDDRRDMAGLGGLISNFIYCPDPGSENNLRGDSANKIYCLIRPERDCFV
jgi:hypothetical protein